MQSERRTRPTRDYCMRQLEGVDLYWHNEKSKSHFGKCWMDDYPFHAYVVYDDGTEPSPIWDDEDVIRWCSCETFSLRFPIHLEAKWLRLLGRFLSTGNDEPNRAEQSPQNAKYLSSD